MASRFSRCFSLFVIQRSWSMLFYLISINRFAVGLRLREMAAFTRDLQRRYSPPNLDNGGPPGLRSYRFWYRTLELAHSAKKDQYTYSLGSGLGSGHQYHNFSSASFKVQLKLLTVCPGQQFGVADIPTAMTAMLRVSNGDGCLGIEGVQPLIHWCLPGF